MWFIIVLGQRNLERPRALICALCTAQMIPLEALNRRNREVCPREAVTWATSSSVDGSRRSLRKLTGSPAALLDIIRAQTGMYCREDWVFRRASCRTGFRNLHVVNMCRTSLGTWSHSGKVQAPLTPPPSNDKHGGRIYMLMLSSWLEWLQPWHPGPHHRNPK